MTRINCIAPAELSDAHLLAEYRELPRVFRLARPGADIPETYRLGKGHVIFFYDKLEYLFRRQDRIIAEMKRRGFKPQFSTCDLKRRWGYKSRLWNDWTPTAAARTLNRHRIAERNGGR